MVPSGMVGLFPSRIGNRSLSDFNDAIASDEPDNSRSVYQLDVRPLKSVAMNVIRDLTKENPIVAENPIGFRKKRRIQMREIVPLFRRCLEDKTKSIVEILLLVAALVWNMWGIVYNHVK